MLERAVSELKGEPVVDRPPVSLHLAVDIKLPESFMPDDALPSSEAEEQMARLYAEMALRSAGPTRNERFSLR